MARTTITPQRLNSVGGEAITFQEIDAANGMQCQNTGGQVLLVQSGTGDSVTVTIPSQPDAIGRTGNEVGVVSGFQTKAFGPIIPPEAWGDAAALAFFDFTGKTGSPRVAVVTIT